jgi:hypothetical protein
VAFAATRVFYDGFESGNTNLWDFAECPVVSAGLDGTSPYTGSNMIRCNWDGVAEWFDPNATLEMTLGAWPYTNEMFLRTWVREDADVDATIGSKLMRLGFMGPDTTYMGCQNEHGIDATMFMYWETATAQLGETYWGGEDRCKTPVWHKWEIYIKHDSNNADGIVRVWWDGAQIWQAVNTNTNTSGAHWYPLNVMSNWSSNPGWEHDANNHVYWDDVEIYSDATSGTLAVGLMSDASIHATGGDTIPPTAPVGLGVN